MADSIEKFLRTLSMRERERILHTMQAVRSGNTAQLHIKKLRGHTSLFRVRVGSIRIVFEKGADTVHFVCVERKGDNTYKNLQ